jgi:hypothetical protein
MSGPTLSGNVPEKLAIATDLKGFLKQLTVSKAPLAIRSTGLNLKVEPRQKVDIKALMEAFSKSRAPIDLWMRSEEEKT